MNHLLERLHRSFRYRFNEFVAKRYFPYLYCKYLYKEVTGKVANFSSPYDINEKILWLEFFSDTSEWPRLADKFRVRDYVRERIGEDVLVPLLGKWDKAEDIDFSKLPPKFIIKPNNGSYDSCIVTDKDKTDLEAIRRTMDLSMKHSFGSDTCEPHYRKIKPCIIAEQLLETDEIGGLIDYKLWCFNGKFHSVFLCANRDNKKHSVDWCYYDASWVKHPEKISVKFRNSFEAPRPVNLETMIQYAELLSKGLPQARVDFYNIQGRIYFGEITLTSNFGMMPYFTQDVLDEMGNCCVLKQPSIFIKIKKFFYRWLPQFN